MCTFLIFLHLIPYVTLWPWPLTHWPWTFVSDVALYQIFAKSNNQQRSYCDLKVEIMGPSAILDLTDRKLISQFRSLRFGEPQWTSMSNFNATGECAVELLMIWANHHCSILRGQTPDGSQGCVSRTVHNLGNICQSPVLTRFVLDLRPCSISKRGWLKGK